MKILMVFIVWGVISFGVIFYLAKRVHYTEWHREGKPCLSFEEFISFYNVNPDRWEVKTGWDWMNDEPNNILIYSSNEEVLVFGWKTRQDRKKYSKWVKNKKRYEQDMKTAEILAKLTKSVRKDVALYSNKAQQQAQETYDRILKMMEENNGKNL